VLYAQPLASMIVVTHPQDNLQEFGELDEPGNLLKSKILNAIEAGHVPASAEPKWQMPTELARLETR
jgi:hypothetical protein